MGIGKGQSQGGERCSRSGRERAPQDRGREEIDALGGAEDEGFGDEARGGVEEGEGRRGRATEEGERASARTGGRKTSFGRRQAEAASRQAEAASRQATPRRRSR